MHFNPLTFIIQTEAKIEAEKPQDPSVAEIKVNKKILIELKIEKKPLGVIVVGGKNNQVKVSILNHKRFFSSKGEVKLW